MWRRCVAALAVLLPRVEAASSALLRPVGQPTLSTDDADAQTPASVLRNLQTLRICNAYASAAALEVEHAEGTLDTSRHLGELQYKKCIERALIMHERDHINFKLRGNDVGTFVVVGLPADPVSQLMLVVYRSSESSKGASFKSHAYNLPGREDTQVAIIDTFFGSSDDKVYIAPLPLVHRSDPRLPMQTSENMPLNSVVTVVPGSYQVLIATNGTDPLIPTSSTVLHAKPEANYVVVRSGSAHSLQDEEQAFPEEVFVFPQLAAAYIKQPTTLLLLAILAGWTLGQPLS